MVNVQRQPCCGSRVNESGYKEGESGQTDSPSDCPQSPPAEQAERLCGQSDRQVQTLPVFCFRIFAFNFDGFSAD